jgi:hypothetical protein
VSVTVARGTGSPFVARSTTPAITAFGGGPLSAFGVVCGPCNAAASEEIAKIAITNRKKRFDKKSPPKKFS